MYTNIYLCGLMHYLTHRIITLQFLTLIIHEFTNSLKICWANFSVLYFSSVPLNPITCIVSHAQILLPLYGGNRVIDSLLTSRKATRQKWGEGNSCKLLFGSGVAAPIERKLEKGKLIPLPRKWWLNNGHPCPWWIHEPSAVFPLLVPDSWSIAGLLPSHLTAPNFSIYTIPDKLLG